MKLITYKQNHQYHLGLCLNNKVYNYDEVAKSCGIKKNVIKTMNDFLILWDFHFKEVYEVVEKFKANEISIAGFEWKDLDVMAPVTHPTSCRDGYAFRQHVEAARRNRNVEMIPEFDEYPIFYFTNHNAIQGPGEVWCMPDHFRQLDFELESCIVIGKRGRNIKAADADKYIAGYMIMNDLSARLLQMEEMKLNLGPAKGKDFATCIGPMLVTPDELEKYKVPCKEGHTGNNYNVEMKCLVNGVQVAAGNMSDMDWTFAEIIERCAYGVDLVPGDVIGSGTVGTGCFLELNGTGKLKDPNYPVQWLQEGDVVDMTITELGCLSNTIRRVNTDFSLFALKKKTAKA